MTTDHITPEQKAVSGFFPGFWDDHGWGFGVSTVTRRDALAATPKRYGWDGGYGTSWYVDPEEELIGILMTQRIWDSPDAPDRKSTRMNSSHANISYAVFCLKKKKNID